MVKRMDSEKIGKFIYQLRNEKGYSQYQLAAKIPISRQAVSKWERGQTIPDSSTLIILSDLLQVSINELLKGERLPDNTLENLENTTLEIVDENNRKKKQLQRTTLSSISILFFLLFLFLIYYFVNSYNQIKVYKISASHEKYSIIDGMMITTPEKTYLKIGKIYSVDQDIQRVRLFYLEGKQEITIYEGEDIENIIQEDVNYQEFFPKEKKNQIIDHLYIEINQTEKMKLIFQRDFQNNKMISIRKKKISQSTKEETLLPKEISIIKEIGKKEKDTYWMEYQEENKNIQIIYLEDQDFLSKQENQQIVWIYDLRNQQKNCMHLDEKECEKMIEKDLKELEKWRGN